MPNIIIKTTREGVVAVHNEIDNMIGQESYKDAREQVQKAILKVWPEAVSRTKTPDDELRDLELNPKQLRALAEGFLHRRLDPATTDGQRKALRSMAALCRVSKWVEEHLPKAPIEDLEGLDDEPGLVDPIIATECTPGAPAEDWKDIAARENAQAHPV